MEPETRYAKLMAAAGRLAEGNIWYVDDHLGDIRHHAEALVAEVQYHRAQRDWLDGGLRESFGVTGEEDASTTARAIQLLHRQRDRIRRGDPDRVARLEGEISHLAGVLLDEFGGPVGPESACEMAVRVLREQRAMITGEADDALPTD